MDCFLFGMAVISMPCTVFFTQMFWSYILVRSLSHKSWNQIRNIDMHPDFTSEASDEQQPFISVLHS